MLFLESLELQWLALLIKCVRIGMLNKEAKAEIETHRVIEEAKTRKCST